jgi:hypothetical protein
MYSILPVRIGSIPGIGEEASRRGCYDRLSLASVVPRPAVGILPAEIV